MKRKKNVRIHRNGSHFHPNHEIRWFGAFFSPNTDFMLSSSHEMNKTCMRRGVVTLCGHRGLQGVGHESNSKSETQSHTNRWSSAALWPNSVLNCILDGSRCGLLRLVLYPPHLEKTSEMRRLVWTDHFFNRYSDFLWFVDPDVCFR